VRPTFLLSLPPLVSLLALASPGVAHDLWIERETDRGDGAAVLLTGHRHSDHAGAAIHDYDPAIVRRAACFDTSGAELPVSIPAGSPVRLDCPGAVLFVATSSGHWTKTPYGTHNVPKSEAETPLRSWLSRENVKRVDRWSESLGVALVDELEIVPRNDPLALRPGEKLRLLVARGREPQSGVAVEYAGRVLGTTGEDGLLNVKIRHGGFQIVRASLTEPLDSPDADELVTTTTLCFELPE
jgi:hypothetical protein